MFKFKYLISVIIFSFLLFGTSIIKNKTREIEKKINNYNEVIYDKEKDHKESQLDYYYLTSPSIIEKKVDNLINDEYFPMEYSKIFLDMNSFLDLQNKYVIQNQNEKKKKKK